MRKRLCVLISVSSLAVFGVFLVVQRAAVRNSDPVVEAEVGRNPSNTAPAAVTAVSSRLAAPFSVFNEGSLHLIIPALPSGVQTVPSGVKFFTCCEQDECSDFQHFASFDYTADVRMTVAFPLGDREGLTCRFKYDFTSSLRKSWQESDIASFVVPPSSQQSTEVSTTTSLSSTATRTQQSIRSDARESTNSVATTTATPATTSTTTRTTTTSGPWFCQPAAPVVKYIWSDAVAVEVHPGNCENASLLRIQISPAGSGQLECDAGVCDVLGLAPNTEYEIYVTSEMSPTPSPVVRAKTFDASGKCAARDEGRWLVPSTGYDPMKLSDHILKEGAGCGADSLFIWNDPVDVCVVKQIKSWDAKLPFTVKPWNQCPSCFGASGKCSMKNCKWDCLGGPRSEKCLTCVRDNCNPDFIRCTGLPLAQLPPEPLSN